jgi:hypothetical protein
VLEDLISLAKQQQNALVHFDMNALEEITVKQDANQQNLRKAEELRISFIIEWLGIARTKATSLKLSELKGFASLKNQNQIEKFRKETAKLISELNVLNTTNRILANRAKHSVGTMLSIFTEGNKVCNVKV